MTQGTANWRHVAFPLYNLRKLLFRDAKNSLYLVLNENSGDDMHVTEYLIQFLNPEGQIKKKTNTNLRTRTPTKPRSALAYMNGGFEFMIRDMLLCGDAQM